jgi:hypothetical protein
VCVCVFVVKILTENLMEKTISYLVKIQILNVKIKNSKLLYICYQAKVLGG